MDFTSFCLLSKDSVNKVVDKMRLTLDFKVAFKVLMCFVAGSLEVGGDAEVMGLGACRCHGFGAACGAVEVTDLERVRKVVTFGMTALATDDGSSLISSISLEFSLIFGAGGRRGWLKLLMTWMDSAEAGGSDLQASPAWCAE